MFVRRTYTMLMIAGLAVAACGGSEEPPDPLPPDPVEGAEPSDDATEASSETGDTGVERETEADGSQGSSDEASDVQKFPDVIDAQAENDGDTWTVSATLSSPYDTPERYADAWRVVGPDGTVYGERILTHDHASEQPFTRSESGIEIPADVDTVTIEGRDLEFGYGGATFDLTLPG